MSEYYTIVTKNMETGKERQRSYDTRREALDAWDTAVEQVIPGEMLRLMDIDAGRIMSEYTPMARRKATLDGYGYGGGE